MMGFITFGTVLFLSCSSLSEMIVDGQCELMQYLNIGESGIIQCSFENFLGVSWYNSNENRAILFYDANGDKSGEGFDSGEYDIYPNGSLLVRNVTVEHDGVFTVTKIISTVGAVTVQYDINIKTVVKPTTSYPIIDDCVDGFPSCLISVNSDGYIRCHIDKSRPPVNLTWIAEEHGNDIILPSSYSSFPHDNITFISQTIVSYSVSQLSLLNMFICQVSSIPNNLVLEKESMILVDKVFDYTEAVTPSDVHVEVNFDVILLCSDKPSRAIVWKKLLNRKDSWSTILYTIPPHNHLSEYNFTGFNVDSDGSLLLRSIKTEHEGFYACIRQDNRKEDIALYDVKVYVNPVPAYPVVDGCNAQQYCVLHVTDGDFLNCSIFGIRPDVNLEWKALHATGKVSFEDRSHFVKQTEDRFDVVLTSRVSFSPSSGNRITVECKVTESDSHLFDLSTTIDLVFENAHLATLPVFAIVVILVVTVVVAVTFIILIYTRKAIQRARESRTLIGEEDGEEYRMMQGVKGRCQPTRVISMEEIFMSQLKTKFSLLYGSLQPIPYLKDRMYCVDKVYVEGCIEFLTDVAQRIRRTLTSYSELLTPTCINSKRLIIEGEPGYGKSTLMLQLVYDWCNSNPSSPLCDVDIVIYLRLRQLSGVTSIATAIKRFILPKDTSLSEEDINVILGKVPEILILLDGYDEYPDQDKPESFVHHIFKRELFQDAKVILTTRKSIFPKKVTPNTNKVRLTGFNEESRDKYIRKAVAGDNNSIAEKIKRKLVENPVLGDLCEVPLFFVMFAHMTHENENLADFKSVTAFFSYMIECFHSHMRNKMDDENVALFDVYENDHKKLDKIAFEALNRKSQKIVWEREELTEELGQDFYNQYVRIGILVEEEVLEIADESKPVISFKYKWEVRFYHKLFCEWYAAYHLSDYLRNTDYDNYEEFLKYLDPYDLQYLYRFTCGIDENASRKVIKHFQSSSENQNFPVLCMLERRSNYEVILEQIRKMVSANSMSMNVEDTKLLQRSTIQILDLASKHEISISCVRLDQSFDKVDKDEIKLKSQLILPKLLTVEKIHIETEDDRELTEDDVMKIFTYGLESQRLHEISFGGCLLPLSYPTMSVNAEMIKRKVKVSWCRYGYCFDFHAGLWKVENVNTLKTLCARDVYISNNHSELRQNCITELLKNASRNDIPISSVNIMGSFPRIDESDLNLVLYPGFSFPTLSSLQALRIKDKSERSNDEFAAILRYSSQCTSLKQLWLDNMLPEAIPLEMIPRILISRNVEVLRSESGKVKKMSFETGRWQIYEFPAYHSQKGPSFQEFAEMNDFTNLY